MLDDATPETEATQGYSTEESVAGLMEKYKARVEAPEQDSGDEAQAEDEQPQGTAQAEEEAESPETEGETEFELDFAGEKLKFPKSHEEQARRAHAKSKEIEAGATRKFQEAADLRKAADVERQTAAQIRKLADAHADLVADYRAVTNRMEKLQQLDHTQLDSDTLSRLNFEFNQLQGAKSQIEARHFENLRQWQEKETEAFQAKREYVEKTVSTQIKGWTDRKKALEEYAVSKGVPAENLQGITEPWMYLILDDAAHGHAMRQAKPQQLKRVAEKTQTLKPGAAGTQKSAAQTRVDALEAKVRKTNSLHDATALLVAKMHAKGRKPQ